MNPQDANTQPQTQAPAPQQSQAPQPQTQPQMAVPVGPAPTAPGAQSDGNKMIIILAAAAVAVIGIAAAMYWFLFSPAVQARRVSDLFMSAATKGDLDKLYDLAEAEDEASKDFVKGISGMLEGGKYSLLDKTSRDGRWYFLYEVTGAERSRARTEVSKQGGKWKMAGAYTGGDGLKLMGDEIVDISDEEPVSRDSVTAAEPSGSLVCLSLEDYRWLNFDDSLPSVNFTVMSDSIENEYMSSMYFKPDSTEETSLPSVYDDWAEFATKNLSKAWTFELRGTTNDRGADSSKVDGSAQLANERANTVKQELISRGVPSDRIVIREPINNRDEYSSSTMQDIYRRVSFTVKNPCPSRGLQPGATVSGVSGR